MVRASRPATERTRPGCNAETRSSIARSGKFEATWNALIEGQEGRTRDDLLAEHRAGLLSSDVACEFYNNGDLGREGQVLSYPACKAHLFADRTRVLGTYGEGQPTPGVLGAGSLRNVA